MSNHKNLLTICQCSQTTLLQKLHVFVTNANSNSIICSECQKYLDPNKAQGGLMTTKKPDTPNPNNGDDNMSDLENLEKRYPEIAASAKRAAMTAFVEMVVANSDQPTSNPETETPITVQAEWDDQTPTNPKEAPVQPQKYTNLEDLDAAADAVFYANNGDNKYIFIKDTPNVPVCITADTKDDTRIRGKYYNKILIVGDFYRHNVIIDETGDFADIILVDNADDIVKQWEAYRFGGTNQFSHVENRIDPTALYTLIPTGEFDEDGIERMEMVLMTPQQAVEELIGANNTVTNKTLVANADSVVAKSIIGQRYADVPVIEVTIGLGQSIKFAPSSKSIGGVPFFQLILEESNFDIPFVSINVEKSQELKTALATYYEDVNPYELEWARLERRLAVMHGNVNFPFVVLATDNGFTLLPKPLAAVFLQFAGKHVEVVEYLKVLTQLSLGITKVNTLISKDLYFKAPKDKKVKISPTETVEYQKNKIYSNGTDGMSMVRQEILTDLGISKNDGVQFRALSAEVVEAIRQHDWSDFNNAWRDYFAKAKESAIKAILSGTDWSEFAPEFDKPCVLEKVVPQAFSVKAAKELMTSVLGPEGASEMKHKIAGENFVANLERWWHRNAPTKTEQVECGSSLFSKGAATPAVAMHKQIQLITQYETGKKQNIVGVDMITPKANFKCYGKVALKKLEKGNHVVSQYMAIINPVSGGSMVTTPHCFEAGGTGMFDDMTTESVTQYKTSVDKYRSDLVNFVKEVDCTSTTTKLKTKVVEDLEAGLYPQPVDLQEIRSHVNANLWLCEDFKSGDYPGTPSDLLATKRGNENCFRAMSREMSGQMIQGRKQTTNVFKLLHMCQFVSYDQVSVPTYLSHKFHAAGKAEKQPIQSTSNCREVKVAFANKSKWIQGCIASMGYSTSVNVYFGSVANCELDWFADDDGDVLNITFIPKATKTLKQRQARFNGIVSTIVANVKMARLQRCAAELATMELSQQKGHNWLDTSIPGTSPLDKFGVAIGLFVNQSSLSNNAGHKFNLPLVGINDNVEFAKSFNFHATLEGQCELDAPKKDKVTVPFMVIHTQKVWNSELELWELPQEVLDHMVPWCTAIRANEWWDTFTHTCGTEVINPKAFVIEEKEGVKTITYNGEQWTEEQFNANLLWCNRDVLERWFGSTPAYVGWMEKLLTDKYDKHNYVTHYKSGWRFVSQESLRNRTRKVGKTYVTSVSPLAPVDGKQAGIFANPNRLVGRSGFGINIQTGKKNGPDYRYMGDKTLVSVSHKVWLKVFWMKWERFTGISAISARNVVEAYIKQGQTAPQFYDVVTGNHESSREILLNHLFGEQLSEYQIFRRIIGAYAGSLETWSVTKLINTIGAPKEFQWRKSNSSFGSEDMVDLSLALANVTLKMHGEPMSPEEIEGLVVGNISNGVLEAVNKSLWTMLLDYTMIPIIDRFNVANLTCKFGKALSEIEWSALANDPSASQGIVLKASSLHMKVTGVAFDQCKCCRPIIIQGLKSLGRKQDKVALEAFKAEIAEYLSDSQTAFGKPVLQKFVGKGWNELIPSAILDGSWLSISEYNKVSDFFGGFWTKGNMLVESEYSPSGFKISRKSDSWKRDDGKVLDADGAEAFDSANWTRENGPYAGAVILNPSMNKEEFLAWVEKSEMMSRRTEGNRDGATTLHLVHLDPKPVTVAISTVPPAPVVIDTPSNDEVDEDYESIMEDYLSICEEDLLLDAYDYLESLENEEE